MQSPDGRPIYLNLMKIRLPMPGIISIMHRGFGVLLSLSIPVFTYLFALSLESEAGFNTVIEKLNSALLMPVYLVLLWGFIHHLLAGIRYLLIDIEIGVERNSATKSSYAVLIAALLVTFLIAMVIWL